MKLNQWMDAMAVGCTDGHYYQLSRDNEKQLWLSGWPDDGSMTERQLDRLTMSDQIDLGGFCDVSESAFSTPDDLFNFAKEIAPLFEVDAVTIVKSIRG